MSNASNLDLTPRTCKPVPLGDLPVRQRAFLETIFAYYYRGHAVQYDSVLLTIQEKFAGGNLRETDFTSPEMATVDDYMCAVCSSFPWEALYNAFGYQLEGSPLAFKSFKIVHTPADNPVLAYRYYEVEGRGDCETPNMEARRKAAHEIYELLQPGDIITSDEKTGHTMVYVGDFLGNGTKYLMHCCGRKYNMETGREKVEHGRVTDTGGAIRIDPVEYFLFEPKKDGKGPMWPIGTHPRIVVLRPLQCMDEEQYPLTPAAVTRLQFPRLSYDRRASHSRFCDVEPGGDVTVTVTIKNNAPHSYTEPLTITERVPENCRLKPGSVTMGGKVCGDIITWEKQLEHGEAFSVSYTVTATGRRGSTIVLGGGSVGAIASNTIEVPVGGAHLSEEKQLQLDAVADGAALSAETLHGAAFAEKLYEVFLQLKPGAPSLSDCEKKLFVSKEVDGAPIPMLHPAENTDKKFQRQAQMLVPAWFGGMEVHTVTSRDRILTISTKALRRGDIILSQDGARSFGVPDCLVYLGNERLAAPGENGTVKVLGAEILEKLLPSRLFVCLRPSLAYEDVNAEAVFEPEVDEAALAAIPDGPEKEELLKKAKGKKAEAERLARETAREQARKEYELRQKAVVETAMAYWRRGKYQQYDSVELINAESRDGVGVCRQVNYRSPEDSTPDDTGFFVCSTFAFAVYWEALRYPICVDAEHCACKYQLRVSDDSVVYHWMEDFGESKEDAIKNIRQILRPGDVLTTMKATGHCMLFVGDVLGDGVDYILHSWGKKYNMTTGRENFEENGTVTLQPADQLCFTDGHKEWYKKTGTPRWSLYDDQREIIVLRPLRAANAKNYPLTDNARARLACPGLNLTRVCDIPPYHSVPTGGRITYTVTVENRSETDYRDLPIMEKIPDGTKLIAADGRVETDRVRWLVTVPAGGSVSVSHTVEVVSGSRIVSEGGSAAGIGLNRIVRQVRNAAENGKMPEDMAKFLRENLESVENAPGADTRLVRFQKMPELLVPRFVGGRMLLTDSAKDRILDFDTRCLMEGDVLVTVADPLGKKEQITVTEAGDVTEELLWGLFTKDLFFLLRPGE